MKNFVLNGVKKVKGTPKFSKRKAHQLIVTGWVVDGDRRWAAKDGKYITPESDLHI